jgi:hypothetical protein
MRTLVTPTLLLLLLLLTSTSLDSASAQDTSTLYHVRLFVFCSFASSSSLFFCHALTSTTILQDTPPCSWTVIAEGTPFPSSSCGHGLGQCCLTQNIDSSVYYSRDSDCVFSNGASVALKATFRYSKSCFSDAVVMVLPSTNHTSVSVTMANGSCKVSSKNSVSLVYRVQMFVEGEGRYTDVTFLGSSGGGKSIGFPPRCSLIYK